MLVVFGEVSLKGAFQFFAGFVDRLLQALPGQDTEEASTKFVQEACVGV